MNILIQHGLVIDPASSIENKLDVFISDGKIAGVGKPGSFPTGDAHRFDAAGKIVVPGLIDMHVHLREPGFEYKETIATGAAAALAGGFTSICCMPNTSPVNDSRSVTEFILAQAGNTPVHVFPIGAITKGSQGEVLAEMAGMRTAGCIAVSDDGRPVMNSALMRRAMETAKSLDIPVISHCEDWSLAEKGIMNEGPVSRSLGLEGIPAAAEDIMVARDVALAELTGCRLHIAHVSTAGSVRILRDAKARGVKVTAETCPHYFTLTEEAIREKNTLAKMNPPLRTSEDVNAIKQGLKDGTIDVIATDHAPHSAEEKRKPIDKAPFGIIGLETALGLSLGLVREGVLSLTEIITKMSFNPAAALNLHKGTLLAGADADITIIDPLEEWIVDVSRFKSKAKNSPFDGWKLKGRATATIVGGTL
jgi:dihydroorotase